MGTSDRKSAKKLGGGSAPAVVSDVLPPPPPPSTGAIGDTYADSKPDIISLPAAPAGAPNILLVMLDDVGFGQASTLAVRPTRRHCSGWPTRVCATTAFTPPPCAHRRALRCSPGETITRCTPARSPRWPPASRVTTAVAERRRMHRRYPAGKPLALLDLDESRHENVTVTLWHRLSCETRLVMDLRGGVV